MSKEKLTTHQNQKITEALCFMAIQGEKPDNIKDARRSLVTECEEINLRTTDSSLANLNKY